MSNLLIFTDGAYSFSRDQGGIGVVFVEDNKCIKTYSKMFEQVSNNKMELVAVIVALQTTLKNDWKSVTIMTDSQYVIGCATKGWKRKKNVKLWARYDKIIEEINSKNISVKYEWIHGHNGDKFNTIADKLAVEASHETKLI